MNFEMDMKRMNRQGLLIAGLHLVVLVNIALELLFV